ncbi:nose resistant to fluoxetine protein 6-like protein [Dinothrombium tinctorium]|uniref:Nose resistant to fluoxetine protein 6-like protein n=1 Tax=Dinothrombium tinctorium TaxID=1965070 RepID=A0A443RJ69_9ACAR|nr:nose resistant to fluoxetine protein 6-like protein [Dinothrombium tinctorium]
MKTNRISIALYAIGILIALTYCKTANKTMSEKEDEEDEEEKKENKVSHKDKLNATRTNETVVSKDPFVRWIQESEKKFKERLKNFVITPEMVDLYMRVDDADLSETCLNSFGVIHHSFKNYETWVFKMMDSSGKVPGGLFYGTMASLGNYDECLDIEAKHKNQVKFVGQYCAIDYRTVFPKSFNINYLKRQLKLAHYLKKLEKVSVKA